MHTSVFKNEVMEALNISKGKVFIDATFGQGGHSEEIKSLGGTVLGIEIDPDQVKKYNGDIKVVNGSFEDLEKIAKENITLPIDGVLFDFGLSMVQLKEGNRGFSYRSQDDPLDMRMSNRGQTVAEYLQEADGESLLENIMKYSEDIHSQKIVDNILKFRNSGRFEKVSDLLKVIDEVLPSTDPRDRQKTYARVFQALRMIVNNELGAITKGLAGAIEIVKTGGRIVIITFHSIEDRLVKKFARDHKEQINSIRSSVSSSRKLAKFERSATLRVFTKI